MKHIKLFEELIDEDRQAGFLFRNTHPNWLIGLLKKGMIKAEKGRFLSFSEDSESGGADDYGSMQVQFNRDEMKRQGIIQIDYTPYFFENNPKICFYVSGYESEEDYYESIDVQDADEAWENGELSWDDMIEDYSGEEEWVMDKIKWTPELINHVRFKKNPKLQKLLDQKGIKYTQK